MSPEERDPKHCQGRPPHSAKRRERIIVSRSRRFPLVPHGRSKLLLAALAFMLCLPRDKQIQAAFPRSRAPTSHLVVRGGICGPSRIESLLSLEVHQLI
jgi:hypothetical protein